MLKISTSRITINYYITIFSWLKAGSRINARSCDTYVNKTLNLFVYWCIIHQPLNIAAKFRGIAGFPLVAGCIDGTHIPLSPPHNNEEAYVNRHYPKSLNVTMVAHPDYTIYFCSSQCPGRWHDSRVIKESTLWTTFGPQGHRPFSEALILGDSA